MIISICGVPGVGKTTIAKELSKKINFEYIDLNKLIIDNKLYDNYDEAYESYIVDEEKLNSFLKNYLDKDKDYIIDGILSYLINADVYFIIKADPNILKERLEKRNYKYNKIFENIWAMNLGEIEYELEENRKEYYIFYNNIEYDINDIINKIIEIINRKKS